MREHIRRVTPKADAPCYGCEDRVIGCHATCNRHIDWCKGWDSKLDSICDRESEEFLLNKNKRRRRYER